MNKLLEEVRSLFFYAHSHKNVETSTQIIPLKLLKKFYPVLSNRDCPICRIGVNAFTMNYI